MPVKLAKVRINDRGHGTVELDGLQIPGVRAVTVETEVNCRPIVRLEIVAREVDLRQMADVDEEGTEDAAP